MLILLLTILRETRTPSSTILLFIWLVITVASGCGQTSDGLGRIPISGTVTMDGQSLSSGSLSLTPQSSGPACGTSIRDGKFDIPKNRGPVAGIYNARITIDTAKSISQADEPSHSTPAQYKPIVVTIVDDNKPLKLQFVADTSSPKG